MFRTEALKDIPIKTDGLFEPCRTKSGCNLPVNEINRYEAARTLLGLSENVGYINANGKTHTAGK